MNDGCEKIQRELSAYMDGELGAAESGAVKEHLTVCEACSCQLREAAERDAELKRLPEAEPGPFFAARVMAAVRSMKEYRGSLRRFLRFPVPAMAALTAFILLNIFTFAFNINAMENGPRREIARKVVMQLAKPASVINPVALARLCGECSKYMCLCMHEAGKKSNCPCKDCEMEKERAAGGAAAPGGMDHMEGN